jgi:hypothetical protein
VRTSALSLYSSSSSSRPRSAIVLISRQRRDRTRLDGESRSPSISSRSSLPKLRCFNLSRYTWMRMGRHPAPPSSIPFQKDAPK